MPDVLVLPLRLCSWKSFFLKKQVDIVDTPMASIWNLLLPQAYVRTDRPPATIACQAFTVDG